MLASLQTDWLLLKIMQCMDYMFVCLFCLVAEELRQLNLSHILLSVWQGMTQIESNFYKHLLSINSLQIEKWYKDQKTKSMFPEDNEGLSAALTCLLLLQFEMMNLL